LPSPFGLLPQINMTIHVSEQASSVGWSQMKVKVAEK